MPSDGPSFHHESAALKGGALRVAGVDEVGRGPLAGPVTAAAVVLDPACIPDGLHDSKALTPQRRSALCETLMGCAEVSIGHASVEEIDALNILYASHLAMVRAVAGLSRPPCLALVDGNMIPKDLPVPAQALVKGDALSVSVAAASIMAKVHRDAVMRELAQQFPGYGWETNVGYSSRAHQQALLDLGVTPHHRRSFTTVHNILYQEKSISP